MPSCGAAEVRAAACSVGLKVRRSSGREGAQLACRWIPREATTQLSLDFRGCGIGDEGAAAVAAALPAGLTQLSLDFWNCYIGAAGAQAVAAALPAGLTQLSLSFRMQDRNWIRFDCRGRLY